MDASFLGFGLRPNNRRMMRRSSDMNVTFPGAVDGSAQAELLG
jgi:hypothetical protein